MTATATESPMSLDRNPFLSLAIAAGEAEKELRTHDAFAADTLARALQAAGCWKSFREPFQTIEGQWFWFPIDIWVVAMDETEYWNLPAKYKKHIERVECVYFFDSQAKTHLSSLTASYCMWFVENRAVFKGDVDDDLRDEIDSWIRTHQEEERVGYQNCDDVERFITRHQYDRGCVHHHGNPGIDLTELDGDDAEAQYNSLIDGLLEGFCSNSVL